MNSPPVLLFVCTGNICRSPIAQVIAQDAARRAGVAIRVASAGTAALVGHTAHDLAQRAVDGLGLDLGLHRARQITREMATRASLVITATNRQRNDLRMFFPSDREKIVSFADVTGLGELTDPYSEGPEAFAATANLLRAGMPHILDALPSP